MVAFAVIADRQQGSQSTTITTGLGMNESKFA
jgi:hypothetical protein